MEYCNSSLHVGDSSDVSGGAVSVRGVLAVCVHQQNSFGIRIGFDSSIKELKDFACSRWDFLTPLSVSFSFFRDGKNNLVETDAELQSLACYFWMKGELSVQIDVTSTLGPDSSSSCSGVYNQEDSDLVGSIRRGDYGSFIKGLGQRFPGGAPEFRICLLLYCVKNGYRVRIVKSDPKRVTAVCFFGKEKNCGWRVHASLKFNIPDVFIIKRLNLVHSCGAGYKDIHHPSITSKVVKAFCIDQVRANPMIKTRAIMDSFMLEFGSMLKYYFAYSGKGLAIKEIHGDDLLSFNQLVWYVEAVKVSNPGSHVVLEIDNNRKFRRIFIALEASISGFNHCRPLLIVDGTFLKGKLKGCLMAATAKNANQGNFPVALAIVLAEDEDNWVWFMENLKVVIDQSREYVFISDRHWGLIKSIARVFPSSFHSFCLYHLKRNLASSIPSSNKSGSWIVKLFRDIAYAETIDDFNEKFELFMKVGGKYASNFLKNLPLERFTRVHFPGRRYGEMSSNVAESFNAWILEERFLPITSLLDEVRLKLMSQMSKRRELGRLYTSDLCPVMEERLKKIVTDGLQWFVSRSSKAVFEVRSPISQCVDIEKKLCSCNMWSIIGFPCAHAVRAIMVAGLNIYEFVDPYYLSSSFRASYSSPIHPIATAGKPTSLPISPLVLPPDVRRQPGRPATKRKEGRGGGLKRPITCGKCQGVGHNKRSCHGV